MAIKIKCPKPGCGQIMSVKEEYAGKKGKCPVCGTPVMVPAASAPPKSSAAPAAAKPAASAKPTTPMKPTAPAKPDSLELPDDPGFLDEEDKPPARTVAPAKKAPAIEEVEFEVVAPPPKPRPKPPTLPARPAAGPKLPQRASKDDDEVIDDLEVVEDEPAPRAARTAPRRPARPPVDEEDMEVLEEVEDNDKEDRRGSRRPARRAGRRYPDEDDDLDEEDDDRQRPRRSGRASRRRSREEPVDVPAVTTLGIGLFFLIMLVVSLFLGFFVSGAGSAVAKKESMSLLGNEEIWEAKVFLILGSIAILLSIATLIIVFTVRGEIAQGFIDGTAATAAGLGVSVVLFILATLLKMIVIMSKLSRIIKEKAPAGAKIELPSVFSSLGFGFWLLLISGLVVTGLFCFLGTRGRQIIWLTAGLGVGLLLALCMIIFDIKPWDTGIP